MSTPLPPPPPRRTVIAEKKLDLPYSSTAPPTNETWKAWGKRKGGSWGGKAMEKGIIWSDNIGGKVNNLSEQRLGSERFWPVSGDFPLDMEKAARILRLFTVDGVEQTVQVKDKKTGKIAKRKVAKKIPSRIIRQAKGLVIFTSMRSGIMPFGGAGGSGVIVAKLPDGTWSAPSSTSPNNLTAGAMIGVDIYNCVLVIRTQEALDTFKGHKITLGAEMAVAAGPYGAGVAVEGGWDKSPVLSYISSKGFYAGVEAVAQVFVTRTEENENTYFWPGVTPGDILEGKTKLPREAESLQQALHDAETGRAQRLKDSEYDEDEFLTAEATSTLELEDGEVLRLPPTPDQLEEEEMAQALKESLDKRYLR